MKQILFVVGVLLLQTGCPKPCESSAECNDGLYCNGTESCENKVCKAGTTLTCDDGIACTIDSCSEDRRICQNKAPDADSDGYASVLCSDARGERLGDDCDDTNAGRHPGNLEVCDVSGIDEDCDLTTLGGIDSDGDGYVDSRCSNLLPDGGGLRGLDCNDSTRGVHPGQAEQCNSQDDNCDGVIDEGVLVSRFTDADNDGWGAGQSMMVCATAPLTSPLGTDCNDANPAIHPGEVRCIPGGQGLDYAFCQTDGGEALSKCATRCVPQPNGRGICL